MGILRTLGTLRRINNVAHGNVPAMWLTRKAVQAVKQGAYSDAVKYPRTPVQTAVQVPAPVRMQVISVTHTRTPMNVE